MKIGFDHKKYLEEQSKFILERVQSYDKLYLEFGGKLLFDMHAKRVLPGFDENAKIKLLQKLKEKVEVVICVYSGDIERNKIRGDFGITYDLDVLRLIDDLRAYDLDVNSVVITRYEGQPATNVFINKLERRGIKVYKHEATPGYPTDVDLIVSDEGYGKNPYIETTKPIVVVTAPGPGSGKLATCLSQLYHEFRRGKTAGYSKFETFPVWNLPLKHPVNVAYEAATVDLKDVNMIDPFHLEAYNSVAVNYNRDIETFPVLKRIIEKITGKEAVYKSPTDMGVNRVGFGITDDEAVKEASRQEIIRRYYKTGCEYKKGYIDKETFMRSKLLMDELNLKEEDRKTVTAAREYSEKTRELSGKTDLVPAIALELEDGTIITGRRTTIMDAAASALLNAVKHYAKIADEIHLISPVILEPIVDLKMKVLHSKATTLNSEEILIALSICAATNPMAQVALKKLSKLKGCQAHSTTILSESDEQTYRKLGIDVTSDPEYSSSSLFYGA
ncbi:MAG: ATP-dependent Zn protease [Firmicutes bacterium]|nr:ATP-dependent Zn protease [Bacillota bacterium]